MNILYIHQYFTTPSGYAGIRSYEFSRRWVKAGHNVTVITSTTNLTQQDLRAARGKFIKRFTIEGVNVVAISVPYNQKMSYPVRVLSFLVFMLLASIIAVSLRKIDVVYATSTPLTIGLPAIILRWVKRVPFVFEVRDQWPASIIEMGVCTNKLMIRILSWMERFTYRNSAAIVALSEGIAEGVKDVISDVVPIYVVDNGADLDIFGPQVTDAGIRDQMGWNEKLIFIRAGNMGRTSGLDFILDVAMKTKEYDDILLVMIGDGCNRQLFHEEALAQKLNHLIVLPPVDKPQLAQYLQASDVIMIVTSEFEIIERHASLNKFYDGLAAGKCLLLNYRGWHGKLVEENNAGFACSLYNVGEFVEKIDFIRKHRQQLGDMGKNARSLAETKFDRGLLAKKALGAINEAKSKK